MNKQRQHFLIMAGGTGGHVFPGLAVAKELISLGYSVSWLGTSRGIEAELVPKANIPIDFIQISGVRGKGFPGLLLAPFRITMAILQSLSVIRKVKPSCVLGMGGFVAGPGAIAAKIMGIPLVIHEQNAIPGTTNRILAKIANKVLAAFPNAFPASMNAEFIGNPVRSGIAQTRKEYLDQAPLHLLVVGGSLGAKAINDVMPQLISTLEFPIEVWHQTGKAHFDQVKALYENERAIVKVMPFIENMAEAFAWADLVICRSGAMTVSELAVAGLPAIFIPFPYAIDDHQTANAKWMVNAGAAILMPQTEMSVGSLKKILSELNSNRKKIVEMRNKAAALGIHDATSRVANYCVELAL